MWKEDGLVQAECWAEVLTLSLPFSEHLFLLGAVSMWSRKVVIWNHKYSLTIPYRRLKKIKGFHCFDDFTEKHSMKQWFKSFQEEIRSQEEIRFQEGSVFKKISGCRHEDFYTVWEAGLLLRYNMFTSSSWVTKID